MQELHVFFGKLRLRIILIVAASGALLVVLQMSAPYVGLSRDVGLWIWGAGTVILIGLILGPPLAKITSGRTAALLLGAILGMAAACYLYVDYILLPQAIERANADKNEHQSAQPR